jgi:hypothetical protein
VIEKPKYKAGQWICAMSGGVLVYSVIRYVRDKSQYPYGTEYITDHGQLVESQIVEAR